MDSFSSFLSSFDTGDRKSKKKSKSIDVKSVKTSIETKHKFSGSKMSNQGIPEPHDHNYHKKNVVEISNQTNVSITGAELEAIFESKSDSPGDNSGNSLPQAKERPRVSLHEEKVDQRQDMIADGDVHEERDRKKRKMADHESLPANKKLKVDGYFSHKSDKLASKLRKVKDVDNDKHHREECIVKSDSNTDERTCVPLDKVCSVKVVNGRSIDFRCTLCKKLPRQLSRSELYRHYASCHFNIKLNDLFGHLKICPYCHVDLRTVSTASHFGQKHSLVENFLPTEAWIPLKSRGVNKAETGMKNSNLTQVENNKDVAFEALWVWPQIPEGFNPGGNARGSERGYKNFKQSFTIATIEGFDIEVKKDDGYRFDCCEQEDFVQSSETSIFSLSAHEQVIQCRICKMKIDQKQLAVQDVHSVHVMKGSGNVFHDFDVLAQQTSSSTNCQDVLAAPVDVVDLCQDTAVEENNFLPARSSELTEEEWELVNAVDKYQQSEGVEAVKVIPTHSDDGYDRSEGDSDDFEARLGQSGDCSEQDQMHLSSDSEWEEECVDYRIWFSNDSKAISESDEPLEVSERDWEVDSINELKVPGRESGYSSTSGYQSSYSGYNS